LVMKMENENRFVRMMKQQAADVVMDQHRREIQRAIDRVKQTEADKVLTRQFFRSEARSKWSDERWRRYIKWRRQQEEEGQESSSGQEREDRWWRWGPGGKLQRRDEKRGFRKKVSL